MQRGNMTRSNLTTIIATFTVLIIGLSVAPGAALAQLPGKINYQGRLTDDAGIPLHGQYELTFRLFTEATAGTHVWEETHDGVVVHRGLFSVILGNNISHALNSSDTFFLEVEVGGQVLMPRQEITSSPFAMKVVGVSPVGTILPWHKSFGNTPSLPEEWAECNGQVVNDPSSPYNGQQLPDLNGTLRFLAGGSSSGAQGGSATHTHTATTTPAGAHSHWIPVAEQMGSGLRMGVTSGGPSFSSNRVLPSSGLTDESSTRTARVRSLSEGEHSHAVTINQGDSLPPYFTVVWIIRIK